MSRAPNQFNSYNQAGAYPLDYSAEGSGQAVAAFFNAVYAWMCAGLALTGVVAWYVAANPHILIQLGGGIWLLFIVELVLVGVISAAVQKVNATVATMLFLLYAGINGIVLSGIFILYAHAVLASAFAVTAGMFGAMSLYGFLTKKDLSGFGSLLFMGLIGIIIASVVSIFWHNSMLNVAINYIGVLIFVGLTAYDTQMLKQWAVQTSGNAALAARMSISGALSLYLDFLNLFLFLLRIMGNNSNR
ncbi:MAG TPA: Bax inhibitor-1/YccA family protein [Tepidisphaeraceae bacterium]|jgi:hypothetical protein|nr:Bax inhibitor-1/YccA family protein [Tepidisphaeraceae bacterium]